MTIQQDWFQPNNGLWLLLMLAIIIRLFYFLTTSRLSKIKAYSFFKLMK